MSWPPGYAPQRLPPPPPPASQPLMMGEGERQDRVAAAALALAVRANERARTLELRANRLADRAWVLGALAAGGLISTVFALLLLVRGL